MEMEMQLGRQPAEAEVVVEIGAAIGVSVGAALEGVFYVNIALAGMLDGIRPFPSKSLCDKLINFSTIKFSTLPWKLY